MSTVRSKLPAASRVEAYASRASWLIAGALALSSATARADGVKGGIKPSKFEDETPNAVVEPTKRAVPDYDGRGPTPTTAGDVLLWGPRLVVAPIYLTTEYLIRRPLGAIISGIEKDRLAQRLTYVFSFGGKQKIGIVPTFFVDFGVLPSVGAYFFWDDVGSTHNHLRVHGGTWGPDWINLGVSDRYDVSDTTTAALSASYLRRSDHPFFGLGPDSKQQLESRYAATTIDVGPQYESILGRGLTLRTAVGVRDTSFRDGSCCGDPSLVERIQAGQLPAPPRFYDGYSIGYQSAELAFDTRHKRPASQTGLRVSAKGQPAFDFSRRAGNSWVNYGATAGGFWDVTGKARVLSLSFSALFSDPLAGSGSDIPFNELVSLGGDGLMRGFLAGRLIDRSAAVATVGYQFPIWVFLDGTLQVSTGNVFGAGLHDFEAGKLRLSTGIGVRTNSSPDHQFEVIGGFGTDTFDNGAKITSFRLAFGATRGF